MALILSLALTAAALFPVYMLAGQTGQPKPALARIRARRR